MYTNFITSTNKTPQILVMTTQFITKFTIFSYKNKSHQMTFN